MIYQPVFFFTVLIFTHPMVSYPSIFLPRYIHMATFLLKKLTSHIESAKAMISRATSSHQAADSAPLHANCQRLHSAQGQICLASLATQRTISFFFETWTIHDAEQSEPWAKPNTIQGFGVYIYINYINVCLWLVWGPPLNNLRILYNSHFFLPPPQHFFGQST